MYLEHFGLNEPPFRITPAADFFFSGDNRGDILDAMIYAIAESEGIIKITGEVGSGKTMLCRMLLERLPPQMENVYLPNPSLSREELLHAIADGLGLNLEGQRVNLIRQTLQGLLAQKAAAGKRVVMLVDEVHAMPLDALEELRLLYNLQMGDAQPLQIVLFGQPELNDKLDQPNMRQLRDRIVHHLNIRPLSKPAIISYLLFRMRTAGYRGPNVFSPAAVRLLGAASNGLLRRVNILADKALLAAFIENTHTIEVRHVKAAIRDSEPSSNGVRHTRKTLAIGGIALAGAFWMLGSLNNGSPDSADRQPAAPLPSAAVAHPPAGPAAHSSLPENKPGHLPELLQQRLAAGQEMLARHGRHHASIWLFHTEDVRPLRMEGFLKRARELGKLSEIYVLPAKINGKDGFRVLYGHYPDMAAARAAVQQLPRRYQDAFVTEPILLGQTG